jgi:curli production assembly/transport component CsgF
MKTISSGREFSVCRPHRQAGFTLQEVKVITFFCTLRRSGIPAIVLAGICLQVAMASELVYTPIIPSFGGNPNNGPNLLSVANAQNETRAPSTALSGAQTFSNALQAALLSHAESQILSSANANTGIPPPQTYNAGGYTITVSAPSNVQYTDPTTGIVVPVNGVLITTLQVSTGAVAGFVISGQ